MAPQADPDSTPMQTYWNSEQAQNWTGALVLIIVSALCLFLLVDDAQQWTPRLQLTSALFMLQTLSFILFISPWAMASRSRLLLILWVELALIGALYALVEISFVAILGIVWIVQAAETFSIRVTSWLLALMIGLFTASQLHHLGSSSLTIALSSSVTLGLFHLFAVITTHRAKREQRLREETAALNRELLATRELLSQSARQSERLRIARDLHDLLGHHLTALILNLEVASHLTTDKGQQKVEQALALGKLLLADLRTAVSELRGAEHIDLRQALASLVTETPRVQVEVVIAPGTEVQDVRIAEALLRCTQEALTNCLRHGNATRCTIELMASGNALHLTAQDNGSTVVSVVPGNGLTGILERVRALGGEAHWHSRTSGFTLHVTLPATLADSLGQSHAGDDTDRGG